MAKQECISAVVRLEHQLDLVETFIDAIEEAAGDAPPAWLLIHRQLFSSVKAASEDLGKAVRK